MTVGDTVGSDKLKAFCFENGIAYVKLGLGDSFADCHNHLLKQSDTPWHMHLYPGETLVNPEEIQGLTAGRAVAYRLPCVQSGWLNKEVRLYHRDLKCRFSRAVFEAVEVKGEFAELYITGGVGGGPIASVADKWVEKNPLALTPRYYKAISLLLEGKQVEFVAAAKEQLFADNKATIDNIMLRYYLACALAANPATHKECGQQIVECLAANVLMAEFWCLLGDVCFAEGGYERAKAFYRNAVTLGSQRRKDDEWPMHIAKYKKHPDKMIAACDETVAGAKNFKIKW
jgi:hypothetical protein